MRLIIFFPASFNSILAYLSILYFRWPKAVVTSALPLTDEEQANVKKALSAAVVEFKVDPRILGGLIVRAGDQVVDNSVASQMSALRDSLN